MEPNAGRIVLATSPTLSAWPQLKRVEATEMPRAVPAFCIGSRDVFIPLMCQVRILLRVVVTTRSRLSSGGTISFEVRLGANALRRHLHREKRYPCIYAAFHSRRESITGESPASFSRKKPCLLFEPTRLQAEVHHTGWAALKAVFGKGTRALTKREAHFQTEECLNVHGNL
ncbi:hypothetical protein TNCV_484231 [Trichonephila clavipes]|nr:hypothetical protein TNCV_484231 [Trichonephila clavipes]